MQSTEVCTAAAPTRRTHSPRWHALLLSLAALWMTGCGALISPPEPEPQPEPQPEPVACMSDDECGANERCDLENFCDAPPDCAEGEACDAVCYGRCIDDDEPQPEPNPEPEPTGCYSDQECEGGQLCDTINFCDPPPGCEEGMDCPAVCYGRCVDPRSGCFSDGDCADDEFCRFADVDLPADEDGTALVAPEGICVPRDCGAEDIALPACPPNTIPVVVGECGEVICEPIDHCSDLDPERCDAEPGCRVEEIPLPCECGGEPTDPNGEQADPAPCICDDAESMLICVPADGCDGLGPEACEMNSACEGFYTPGFCDCDPADETCVCDDGFICVERQVRDGCRDSRDCNADEQCEIFTICTDECIEDPNGAVDCISDCWEVGECVYTGTSCYDLSVDECELDPDCQLHFYDIGGQADPLPCDCPPDDANCVCPDPAPPLPPEEAYCGPRENPSCLSDEECGPGQYCELEEWCPPCSDDEMFPCAAPCWVEGVCVDGREPPRLCDDAGQCGDGEECQVIEVCEGACGAPVPPPNGEEPAPPDCVETCYEEAICVPVDRPELCYFDEECGVGFECIIDYDTCGMTDPNSGGLIACPGVCEPAHPEEEYCLQDGDCRDGQRCATELEICFVPPGGPYDVCYSLCVDEPVDPAPGICLENADCREGQRCATELDVCVCDPNDPECSVCYSSCVRDDVACPDVIAYAADPQTGECIEFPTPCDVPADWQPCDADGTTGNGGSGDGTDPGAP